MENNLGAGEAFVGVQPLMAHDIDMGEHFEDSKKIYNTPEYMEAQAAHAAGHDFTEEVGELIGAGGGSVNVPRTEGAPMQYSSEENEKASQKSLRVGRGGQVGMGTLEGDVAVEATSGGAQQGDSQAANQPTNQPANQPANQEVNPESSGQASVERNQESIKDSLEEVTRSPNGIDAALAQTAVGPKRADRTFITGDPAIEQEFYRELESRGRLRMGPGGREVSMSKRGQAKVLQEIAERRGMMVKEAVNLELDRGGGIANRIKTAMGLTHRVKVIVVGDASTVNEKLNEVKAIVGQMADNNMIQRSLAAGREVEGGVARDREGNVVIPESGPLNIKGNVSLSRVVTQSYDLVEAAKEKDEGNHKGGRKGDKVKVPEAPKEPELSPQERILNRLQAEASALTASPEGFKATSQEEASHGEPIRKLMMQDAKAQLESREGIHELNKEARQELLTRVAVVVALSQDPANQGPSYSVTELENSRATLEASKDIAASLSEYLREERLVDSEFESKADIILSDLVENKVITETQAETIKEVISGERELESPAAEQEQEGGETSSEEGISTSNKEGSLALESNRLASLEEGFSERDARELLSTALSQQGSSLEEAGFPSGEEAQSDLKTLEKLLTEIEEGQYGSRNSDIAKSFKEQLEVWKDEAGIQRESQEEASQAQVQESKQVKAEINSEQVKESSREAESIQTQAKQEEFKEQAKGRHESNTEQAREAEAAAKARAQDQISAETQDTSEAFRGLSQEMSNPARSLTNQDKSWNLAGIRRATNRVLRVNPNRARAALTPTQRLEAASIARWMADRAESGRLPGITAEEAGKLRAQAEKLRDIVPEGTSLTSQGSRSIRKLEAVGQAKEAHMERAESQTSQAATKISPAQAVEAIDSEKGRGAANVESFARDIIHTAYNAKKVSPQSADNILRNAERLSPEGLKGLAPEERAKAIAGLESIVSRARNGEFGQVSGALRQHLTRADGKAGELSDDMMTEGPASQKMLIKALDDVRGSQITSTTETFKELESPSSSTGKSKEEVDSKVAQESVKEEVSTARQSGGRDLER